jgi:hypothetical protein
VIPAVMFVAGCALLAWLRWRPSNHERSIYYRNVKGRQDL